MEIIAYKVTSKRFQFLTKPGKGSEGRLRTASCGHLVDCKGLNKWCKMLLKEGQFVFKCPKCSTVWPWQEVCVLACLTQEEQRTCEKIISRKTTQGGESFKKCPDCGLYVQRLDLEKLSVECLPCSEAKKKVFVFCCDCLREWKNPDVQSDSCGNGACAITALLQGCPTIDRRNAVVHGCPKVRACPNCEVLTQHCRTGCSNIVCPNCKKTFCFRCLGSGGYHIGGYCSIAERQKLSGRKGCKKREQSDIGEPVLLQRAARLETESSPAQLPLSRAASPCPLPHKAPQYYHLYTRPTVLVSPHAEDSIQNPGCHPQSPHYPAGPCPTLPLADTGFPAHSGLWTSPFPLTHLPLYWPVSFQPLYPQPFELPPIIHPFSSIPFLPHVLAQEPTLLPFHHRPPFHSPFPDPSSGPKH